MLKIVCSCFITFVSLQAIANFPKLGVVRYTPMMQLSSSSTLDHGKPNFWSRVSFGGNLGLQIGNPTNIMISPIMGYTPNVLGDRLMVGLGVTYIYSKLRYTDYNGISYSFESNVWGGRTFARFLIFDNFFGYTEYELLNSEPYYLQLNRERVWVSSFFLGGGYLFRFSQRGGIMVTVLYNLAWTPVNPVYSSPWNFRVGFMF